jgi:beta-mannosidase
MSWSIIDSFLRPKPAYFSIRRALAPLVISGRRYTTKTFPDPLSAATFVRKSFVDLWAGNSTLKEKSVEVQVEAFEVLSGKHVFHERFETKLEANRSTELKTFEIPTDWDDEKNPVVVTARLRDGKTGDVLSRVSLYPEPYVTVSSPRLPSKQP